jgi:hypothetical protein
MDTLDIIYRYRFQDGQELEIPLCLEKATLALQGGSSRAAVPSWAQLDFNRCKVCSLSHDDHGCCPIAANLVGIVEAFENFFAYETVDVVVVTDDRTYSKSTTIQEGLSALVGIVMVTSGCPVMVRLKPMVRFHLPFASLEESTYRMLSMYLVGQIYRHRQGLAADWDLQRLEDVYTDISEVNECFAGRLRAAAEKDANVNAMVNLDCLGKMIPFVVEDILGEMEGYFAEGLLPLWSE